jgi:hypothetical protein
VNVVVMILCVGNGGGDRFIRILSLHLVVVHSFFFFSSSSSLIMWLLLFLLLFPAGKRVEQGVQAPLARRLGKAA